MAVPVISCLVRYLRFLVPAVIALILIHEVVRPPSEVFRKLLHMVAFLSTPVIMHAAGNWQVATVVLVLFGALVWPLLYCGERLPRYAELFVQRRTHEVRRSMLLLFWGDALLVALCWGICKRPEVAVASILMWGFGDAAAALVGKRYGRHHIALPLADPQKTSEGSLALFLVSGLIGSFVLGIGPLVALAAFVAAYVELITKGGYDTVTVPFAIAVVLLLLG